MFRAVAYHFIYIIVLACRIISIYIRIWNVFMGFVFIETPFFTECKHKFLVIGLCIYFLLAFPVNLRIRSNSPCARGHLIPFLLFQTDCLQSFYDDYKIIFMNVYASEMCCFLLLFGSEWWMPSKEKNTP